jgi:2-methylcitrate dehydratase PrpD
MTMTLASGERFTAQVDHPKGSIENPMSDGELKAKFENLALPVIGAARVAAIADRVMNVERLGDVGELMRLAVPASRRPAKRRSARHPERQRRNTR